MRRNGRTGSNNRLSSSDFESRFSLLLLSMFATMASLYVAGRLWMDAQNWGYLIKELDRRTGQGQFAVSVDGSLKIMACKEQQKKLSQLELELGKARQEGFVSEHFSDKRGTPRKKKHLAVIGIITSFGRKSNRDLIRKAWMPSGEALKKLEDEGGIVVRFVIGTNANDGDKSDRDIEDENRQANDFIILKDLAETAKEQPDKIKYFLIHAVEHWDADFYVKVNDDMYVNIDALGAVLANHVDKSHVYIGCMKSGEVFSQLTHKWYEPDWWKFGDGKSYFRHAFGEIYVISQSLAQYISINRFLLRTYAHDDVSAGSWFIGLNVEHVDEGKFCCSSWSTGAVCAAS